MARKEGREIFDFVLAATKKIQKPAGDDPRFAGLSAVKENMEAFVRAVHGTYKDLHYETIERIRVFENILRVPEVASDERQARFLEHSRAIARRINDALAWIIAKRQRHVIKRACAYRDRTWLDAQNADVAIETLKELNEDPLSLAIWTDATSCIDLGDYMSVTWPNGQLRFVELKTGQANHDILNTPPECDRALFYLAEKYGKKGLKQLVRMMRQQIRAQKILDILKNDTGEDPKSGQKITFIETGTPEDSHDAALRGLLEASAISGDSLAVIDDCLWIYVRGSRDVPDAQLPQLFLKKLQVLGSEPSMDLYKRIAQDARIPLMSLQDGFEFKSTLPIFLRDLPAERISQIVLGRCVVLYYFDWLKFGELFNEHGAQFIWSSVKEGRRELAKPEAERMLLCNGRIPQVRKGDCTVSIGAPIFLMMPYDGMTPRSIAMGEVAMLDYLEKSEKRQANHRIQPTADDGDNLNSRGG